MSATRVATPGKTRTCPHCKATILESAAVCPACQHHLRYDPKAVAEQRAQSTLSAMQVEGVFKHPQAAGPGWEYSVVVSIRNDRGEELVRRVIGVGALQPNESRIVNLSFDVFVPPGSIKS
jgi:hypothetical protein